MAELPILPLKTDALLADTQHMSTEEFGAYCRLLFTMWRHEARLVDDAIELARIAGVTPKQWKAIAERVMRPMIVAGGLVSQKRLSATWVDVQELRKKRAHAASGRWKSKTNANVDANAFQLDVFCNANQNQNQIRENTSSELRPAFVEKVDKLPAGSLATALDGSALTRPPMAEQAKKRSFEGVKRPNELSKGELAELYTEAEARRQAALKQPSAA